MKHLSSFKLFESKDSEIELFEDMLQEYFDQFKIYPKSEIDAGGLHDSTVVNGDYEIKRVSTFKVPGFPDESSGIHIKVHLWKHDGLRVDVGKGLTKFIYRIKKMGYKTDVSYDDNFGVNFHISILDKKVEESIRYLNKGFEVSEDDFINWSNDHELDPNGFNKRENEKINFWSKQSNFNVVLESDEKNAYISISDGCMRIDIARFEDEWFTLFFEDDIDEEYYIFNNWEDLDEKVTIILDNYLNYYELDEKFESVTYAVDTDKIKSISLDEYNDLTAKWKKISLSDSEMKRLEKIFKVWSVRHEIEYDFKNGGLYLEFGGRYFGEEIAVEKYEDDWYVINIIPRDAYTFASRNSKSYESYRQYYTCDQFDGVLELMKEIDDRCTSNQDKTLFESFNNESVNSDWLVKCLTEEEREKWLDEHYCENLSEEEIKMFCDFINSFNEPMFNKHYRFLEPEISDVSVRYYFVTGSYIEFEKMEDDWYYIQTDIIRPTRYFVVDGKEGFEKFKSLMLKMRGGTTDLDYSNINESKLFESISDYSNGLITNIGLEKHSRIIEIYGNRVVNITKSESDFIKSKFLSFDVKFDSCEISNSLIDFIYKGDNEIRFRFHKFIDDWWLLENSNIRRNRSTYHVVYNRCYLIDGIDGLILFMNRINPPGDCLSTNEAKLFGQSDLYEEINQGKYQVLMNNHVKMTQSEVEHIKDELESFGSSLYLKDYSVINSFGGSEERHLIRATYNGRVRIVITKIQDEYFLLRLPSEERFFKCDTIEGLFEIIDIYLS